MHACICITCDGKRFPLCHESHDDPSEKTQKKSRGSLRLYATVASMTIIESSKFPCKSFVPVFKANGINCQPFFTRKGISESDTKRDTFIYCCCVGQQLYVFLESFTKEGLGDGRIQTVGCFNA